MVRDDASLPDEPMEDSLPEADALLLAELREGDGEAGYRFVREYYPLIYRYLLSLTGHREMAEDLTQETFLQAWRHLDQFRGRAPFRLWLHSIARREFLQARRRQRAVTSLEAVGELSGSQSEGWTEAAELRVLLSQLPDEQQEVMLLYYGAGLSSSEIAQILQMHPRTVQRRIEAARAHLAQALGEGDLAYLNELSLPMRQWAWLPLDQMYALEQRLSRRGVGAQEARGPGTETEDSMERREFLQQAAVGAAGLMLPEAEKEVVDSRLTQKVTLAFKATALSDLCAHLRAATGVELTTGASVADEKVTLFCSGVPLRECMRQLSRPFGYTWVRSARKGEYRYELMQDLRSQLLEEELRNRDRNASLLALDAEMERYRKYLGLTPDEALARAKSAAPEEKKLLERLATAGWGPVQMYFRLAPSDLARLRAGEEITFSAEPKPGERSLPPDVARGVIESWRDWRVRPRDDGFGLGKASAFKEFPDALPPAAVPEVRAKVALHAIQEREPGQFSFSGQSRIFSVGDRPRGFNLGWSIGALALGQSPAVLDPENAVANARPARDPLLRSPVAVRPQSSCRAAPAAVAASGEVSEARVTTADVLEALHRATGMPIVADHYTRLFPLSAVSVRNMPLFDALNHLSDAMRLRWLKDPQGGWLQFRSTSYYNDRIKEVPNRLLSRWAASREKHGTLTLDDLVEIAQLPDAQLDGRDMAEGARLCFGLAEWDVTRNLKLRSHLRYLAGFTPAQREEAMSGTGLAFERMPLAQQQRFIALALPSDAPPFQSLDELAGATLRVDYTVPGGFEWRPDPAWLRWLKPVVPGREGTRAVRPSVWERTRAAALQSARRLDPQIDAAQIVPTTLRCTFVYIPGLSNTRAIYQVGTDHDYFTKTW